MRRLAVFVALIPLVWLAGACERQGDGTPSAGEPFTLPEVDASRLAQGLQTQLLMLREAAEQSPENPEHIGALGSIYYVHDFPEAAAACFARTTWLGPELMHWWYYAALAYERVGERQKAIGAYERALQLDAGYGPLYAKLAGLLVKADRERAAALCQRALELNPKDALAFFTLGRCEETGGDLAAALANFGEAVRISPTYKQAHLAMARILASLAREDEARQHREAAMKGGTPVIDDQFFELLLRNGRHLRTLLNDVQLLAERRLFEEAERGLALVRDADPEGVATHMATGMVRTVQGRFEEAAEEFSLVLEDRPELMDVKARLADVQARLGKHQEAQAAFQAVLEQDPDDAYALERYSELLLTLNRAEEAEKLLRAALERRPDQPWLRVQLGMVLLEMDQDDQAREQFQACLEASPDYARARYLLGVLASRAGDLAGARKQWEQVAETTPSLLEAHVALAETALTERDFAAAERHMRAGLKQAPDFPGLANGLAWILATSPDDSQRNGEEAVRLAEKACELTQNRQHEYVDTLAAAYAERGRFDEAVKTAREAIRLAQAAHNEAVVESYQQRLTLYEKKQPYRDVE